MTLDTSDQEKGRVLILCNYLFLPIPRTFVQEKHSVVVKKAPLCVSLLRKLKGSIALLPSSNKQPIVVKLENTS